MRPSNDDPRPQGTEIGAIAISPDGHQVVCASMTAPVIVWDTHTASRYERSVAAGSEAEPDAAHWVLK